MSCDSENWQAKSAYSDLEKCIELLSYEMDCVQDEYNRTDDNTKAKHALKHRIIGQEELYDRLHDLKEMVNVSENKPEDQDTEECDDDDCDCHN